LKNELALFAAPGKMGKNAHATGKRITKIKRNIDLIHLTNIDLIYIELKGKPLFCNLTCDCTAQVGFR